MAAEEITTPGRSAKGCWTCRIRHRKCDEKNPICDECAERCIKCHGYGVKPRWMDGGPTEREERARIKSAVKQNWRRGRTSRTATPSKMEGLLANEAEAPIIPPDVIAQEKESKDRPEKTVSESCTPEASLSASPWRNIQDDTGGSFQNLHSPDNMLVDTHISILEMDPISAPLTMSDFTFEEADLIMHYLDHVFSLQFPYLSSSPKTSRGWLFWLVIKNKPLYEVVLSLSALHQYAISSVNNYQRRDELNVRHVRAIQGVQQFLGQSINRGLLSKQGVVELLACGTSLISFEVFRGGTGDWQPHLNGLASALESVSWLPSTNSRRDKESQNFTDTAKEPIQPEWIDNAYNHLSVVVLWFEILSCTSTAREPKLPYKLWLSNNQIDISQVMGCQNWAMEEIGNLACLQSWKLAAIQSKTLSMQQLVTRGQEIESRLESGLRHLDDLEQTPKQFDIHAVTRIYALAGLVQLHTILWGPHPEISEIRHAVTRAILAISEIEDRKLNIRGLVWPICIVGCMAEPCHQTVMEKMISNVLSQSPGSEFGNLESTLQIMRKCWEKQEVNLSGGYDWRNAMADLDICILFI